jgi:hypothetical protein
MRFAGDAFNDIKKTGGIDPFFKVTRSNPEPGWEWELGPSPQEEAADAAKNAAWKNIRGNRIMKMNEMQVIGDSTLPELYEQSVGDYRRAVVNRAVELQLREKMPPLTAIAQAMREVPPSTYAGGLPAEAAFLRQYAEASRDPQIRRQMDLPENGKDEWGILLSPVDAIKQRNLQSMRGRQPTKHSQELDWFPF